MTINEEAGQGCGLHKLIADVALVRDRQALVVRYADTNRYDHQRGWFLPDDALHHLEDPAQGATRIVAEQLDSATARLGFVESLGGRDRNWHLVFQRFVVSRSTIAPSARP